MQLGKLGLPRVPSRYEVAVKVQASPVQATSIHLARLCWLVLVAKSVGQSWELGL